MVRVRIKLLRAARLGGVEYRIGEHDIPEAAAQGWFFRALVDDGQIVILSETPAVQVPNCQGILDNLEPKGRSPKYQSDNPPLGHEKTNSTRGRPRKKRG